MTPDEYKGGIRYLCAAFHTSLPGEETTDVWYDQLKGMRVQTFNGALKLIARDEKFFPDNVPHMVKKYAAPLIASRRENEEEEDREEQRRLYEKNRKQGEPTAKEWLRKIETLVAGVVEEDYYPDGAVTEGRTPEELAALRKIQVRRARREADGK